MATSPSFLTNPFGSYNPGNPTKRGGLAGTLSTLGGQNQALAAGTQANRTSESGTAIPGYQSLVDSGGYSPTEKASIEQGSVGGIQGAYGTAQSQAQRRMGITGNTAGYGSFLGGLARSKAQALGQNELQVQSQFADQSLSAETCRIARTIAALRGRHQLP